MRSRILLVDDDPHVTAALQDALRREPYDILSAGSAEGGLALLSRQPVDVVISDERMPGLSGSEFLALVRQRMPDTVRMLLTGQASLEAAIRAINEGEIFRFFTKPCRAAELAAAIRQGLRQRRLLLLCRTLRGRLRDRDEQFGELERRHPGITQVLRDTSGAIPLDDLGDDIGDLLRGF